MRSCDSLLYYLANHCRHCRHCREEEEAPAAGWSPMYMLRFIFLCVDMVNDFLRKNCPYVAGAIAFYALFSMFPLVLAINTKHTQPVSYTHLTLPTILRV